MLWQYRAQILSVTDGDTIVLNLDQGMNGRQEEAIRLINVKAPERKDLGYEEAKAYTTDWMFREIITGRKWPLYVRTLPNTNIEPDEKRSFVRYLGTVWTLLKAYPDGRVDIGRCLNVDIQAYLDSHPEWGPGE